MTSLQASSHDQALWVIQQAVAELAKWADPELAKRLPPSGNSDAIARAKKILSWTDKAKIKPLRLLFDQVKLSPGQDRESPYYWSATRISNRYAKIPYPTDEQPDEQQQDALRSRISRTLRRLDSQDWEKNLALLMLILEKFGSYISFGESNDVALVDMARATAALAATLVQTQLEHLSLIAGDLSGIQNFIYTISSYGALKSLRARSFYLELVTEEIVQQLLIKLNLPRTNVIYAGGGNLYLLAAGTEDTRKIVKQVRYQLNKWLLEEFQGKVFLALYCFPDKPDDEESFIAEDLVTDKFANYWEVATRRLAKQKSRKFSEQINELIKQSDAHTPCKVCHRDDLEEEKLQPLNDDASVLVCETCCNMFQLGGQLLKVEAIVRSPQKEIEGQLHTISFKLPETDELPATSIYYHLFKKWHQVFQNPHTVLLVNDWTINHYKFRNFRNPIPLLLGNYGQRSQEETGFMRAGEMAKVAEGIDRVGYLRMDVDKLGQIFAKGLSDRRFPRLAGLSRQMSYFFKVYLNSLAEKRLDNLPKKQGTITTLSEKARQNLLFVYAGGDDLFVSGAWNEIVEFAFDVYQCFRAYTGNNPDITLSGGISITNVKFPLYQAAREAEESEKAAKSNDRDSLGLFGEKFKWSEWLGKSNVSLVESREQKYWEQIAEKPDKPKLVGVLPFVDRLKHKQIDLNYSRSFVRNLLLTAQVQEQIIKEMEEKRKPQQYEYQTQDIQYYLHLPQIAYTLARLPKEVFNDEDFRKSLKSPYNAPYFRAIATWIELLTRSSN